MQFFGDPGSGKTPFAMSLALHVAGGLKTWFGHDIERQGGKVVYMVGEDANGLGWRAQAEQEALGIPVETLDANLLWTKEAGRLSDAEDVARWDREIRERCPEGLAMLMVDTQARNFGDGNENDTQDMSRFVDNVARLVERLGCLIGLVHHTGHQNKERGRGSMALFGAIDASYAITREEGSMTVVATSTKEKNWAKPKPLVGSLVAREVGKDARGQPITAVTLTTSAPPATEVLDPAEEALCQDPSLRAILQAVDGAGDRSVSYKELAATANDSGLEAAISESSAKRRVERLVELRLVEVAFTGGRGKTYQVTNKGVTIRKVKRGA